MHDCVWCADGKKTVGKNFFQIRLSDMHQGSVATHLRWGGIFINNVIAQFQLSMSVKELWKSVNI